MIDAGFNVLIGTAMRSVSFSGLVLGVLGSLSSLGVLACGPAGEVAGPPLVAGAGAPSVCASASQAPLAPPSGSVAILGPEASLIGIERLSRMPESKMRFPRNASYSPDGKLITYLASESNSMTMSLFAFDIASKSTRVLVRPEDLTKEQKPISREEELRRERQRKMTMGVSSYQWAKKSNSMLLPYSGDIFIRSEAGAIQRLTETAEPELDPKICGGGERVVFVRGSELFSVDVASKKESALTKGAPSGITRGQSDFNGQEEFDEPSGFWISPDCSKVAFLEVDERHVGTVPVLGYRDGKADLMMQKYPAAGEKNPIVRPGIVDMASKKVVWLKGLSGERYLGRFMWAPDNKSIWFQTISRDQKTLALVRADANSGEAKEVVTRSSSYWLEFADMVLLEKSNAFVWSVVEKGHEHLELRGAEKGDVWATLTAGDWDVTGISAVDEVNGRVFFMGTKDSPLDRHMYSTLLPSGLGKDGKVEGPRAPVRLTPEPGVHMTMMERGGKGFVDLHSALDRMFKAVVRDDKGAVLFELPMVEDEELLALKLRAPQVVELKAKSGETLYGSFLAPRHVEPGKRYPVVVMVYGGPHAQTVMNIWQPRLMWNHLADRNVAVFQLDNRGSAGRGPGFESVIHKEFYARELEDQLLGLDYLSSLPFIDGSRAAIFGYSYGGSMSLYAMLRAPGRFKVGVAGAPVVDSRLYDTGYTERYMESPQSNAKGYEAVNLTKYAGNLTGRLLLIHSLMDENVHFQNTAEMIDAFVAADKSFDLFVFPGERHGTRNPAARTYMSRLVLDYFAKHL